MRSRDQRRWWNQLAKTRARHRVGFALHPVDLRVIGRQATSPAACSCWMCGNPRKYTGCVTRQEQHADHRMRND
ncbi:MAG: hypothetical protein LC104_22315 [Bacteroidales bacterium]|nr:hypothetical protein [Bacteroidales bacterium]